MNTQSEIIQRIKELEPWRYNYTHGDIVIKSDTEAAKVFDLYGRDLMHFLVKQFVSGEDPNAIRSLDLGCLEGHYSDILCSFGLKEVVSIDISSEHVDRVKFLLKEIRGYQNSTVLQGNVSDEQFMKSLGKFNLIIFHGLLYHLKDPLKTFDILEYLIPDNGCFYLLLSNQYKMAYKSIVSPYPVAELQIKPLQQFSKGHTDGLLYSPTDGSVFERCSFRLNPAAVFDVLKIYGYNGIIGYDTPGGTAHSFHSNLIVTKSSISTLLDELNSSNDIPKVKFYEWDGKSVNSYDFKRRIGARIVRFLVYIFSRITKMIGELEKRI